MKYTIFTISLLLLMGCSSDQSNSSPKLELDAQVVVTPLENGTYLLKDMSVNRNDLIPSENEMIIETNESFEHNEEDSIKYYLIETSSFVPMKITEKPEISANPNPKIEGDTIRLSQLMITLAPEYATLLKEFTTENVGKKIAIVIGGKAITKHKIREPITEGKIQISRCTDEACEVLLTEMENNILY